MVNFVVYRWFRGLQVSNEASSPNSQENELILADSKKIEKAKKKKEVFV
jgi:hypothetical protein